MKLNHQTVEDMICRLERMDKRTIEARRLKAEVNLAASMLRMDIPEYKLGPERRTKGDRMAWELG